MAKRIAKQRGLGLIELLVLLVVISILVSVALQSMTATLSDFKQLKTDREMEAIAIAITGDPEKYAGGTRSEFGYVGDIGSFPPDLNALRSNPGAYATWDGPYLPPDIVEDSLGFKTDEWGKLYAYSGGTSVQSTGSGSTLTKEIARSTDDYLLNSISGVIVDSLGTPPRADLDSVRLVITIPDGTGSYLTKTYNPDSTGNFTLDSIPVGQHSLDIVYTPANDTLHRFVHILPRHRSEVAYKFASLHFDTTSVPTGTSVILRPDGNGAVTGLTNSGCANNYECVDEVTADDDATYVRRASNSYTTDVYSMDDPTVSSGTIDSVVVHCRARKVLMNGAVQPTVYTNSTEYNGTDQNLTTSYVDYSQAWSTNPSTSAAWGWAEINNLQAGVRMIGQSSNFPAYCTQVWIEVFYTN